jgi:hypothetical protein
MPEEAEQTQTPNPEASAIKGSRPPPRISGIMDEFLKMD